MVDMNALERQLADESLRIVGPARPVDDLAVFEAVTAANRQKRWGFTMFSALKIVAAGVIVALFGGFLLAGVLTTPQDGEVPPAAVTKSPSPTTSDDIVPGVTLTVEEVESGVYRVIHDGVRDVRYGEVSARADGSIWLVNPDYYRYDEVRLGSPDDEAYTLPDGSWPSWDPYPVVAPDGTYWASGTRAVLPDGTYWSGRDLWDAPEGAREVTRLHSLEDGAWTVRAEAPDMESWIIAPDGTVWAAYREDGNVVARLGTDGWEPLEDPPSTRGLVVTESGEVWVGGDLGGYMERRDDGSWRLVEGGSLWRYHEDDRAWQEVTVDAVVRHDKHVEVGPDGTVWFAGYEPLIVDGEPVLDPFFSQLGFAVPKLGDPFLMRFDGTEWQRWGPADGVPPLGPVSDATLIPTPDGGLWLSMLPFDVSIGNEMFGGLLFEAPPCSEQWGVAHFDGTDWHHFLAGHCVIGSYTQVAPDGSVWLMATRGEEDPEDEEDPNLYVITPEAVAAKEQ